MAKVLVVDDVASNRELIATLARHRGHAVLEAADGEAALAIVRAERPELVVSDILMPTMDGFEFVRRLRAEPALAATEVVFCTAHYRGREAQNLARTCGVNHVLPKPCEPEEILRIIDAALAHVPLASPQPTEAFDRDHLRLMTDKLAEQVESLQATNARLNALTEITLHMASENDPEVLVRGVCREARNLVVARLAVLCVRRKNDPANVFCATSGVDPEAAAAMTPRTIDEGALGRVFTSGKAWRAAASPIEGLPAGFPEVRSILAAPIASLSVIYGWIVVMDKVGLGQFDDDDERVLVGLAAQLGRVYENGSLYRKLARRADELRESELRFRQLAENIHEVFYLSNADTTQILYVSPAYEAVWGRPSAALYADARAWVESILPEDLAQVRLTGEGHDMRYRIRRPDGEIRWIHDRGFPIRDESGAVYRIAGIAEDITLAVIMERELMTQGNRLRHAQKLALLAHVMTDAYGGFVSWSETLPAMLGTVEGAMPRSTRLWVELLHPDDRAAFRARAIEAARTGVPAHMEYRLRRRDGSWIHLRQSAEPIRDGAPIGLTAWFSIIQDITEQKLAEEEVHRLNADLEQRVLARTAELEAANRELEAYDYSISHDLRAPLNRIEGFTAALLEDHSKALDTEGREHVGRISRAAQTLSQMVSDMLRLSHWNRVELNRAQVDLSALAESVQRALAAAEPGRSVEWKVAPAMSAQADAGLVRAAVENLIGNAWKFTGKRERATIEVGVETRDGEPVFFVRDNGAGFDPLEARDIFKPFRRLASSGSFQGTGVGLATVQRIVSRHGGRLWAEAAPGKGATFYFTLGERG